MRREQDWDDTGFDRGSPFAGAGMGVLRISLLFGSAAVALGLIVAPMFDGSGQGSRRATAGSGLDMTSTGSIGYNGTYTVRRSVLQRSPDSICVIRDDGRRLGDCN